MILLPEPRVPAKVGMKEKVAATLILSKTRSELEIWNELRVRYGLALSCDIARIPLPSCETRVGVDLLSVFG